MWNMSNILLELRVEFYLWKSETYVATEIFLKLEKESNGDLKISESHIVVLDDHRLYTCPNSNIILFYIIYYF